MAGRSKTEVLRDQVESAYKKAYSAFENPAYANGCMLEPIRSTCFEVSITSPPGGTPYVEARGALKIESLPKVRHERPRPRDPGLILLMESREHYGFPTQSAAAPHLTQSMVRLAYYQMIDNSWNARLALRYDFAADGAKGGHPIFHVQLEHGKVSVPIRNNPKVIELAQHLVLHLVRIPTANVIGPLALLKIAADHFDSTSYQEVLRGLRALPFFREWKCDCTSLDACDPAPKMLSSTWYSLQ